MRINWSSDVCSSDLRLAPGPSGDLVGTGRIDGDLEDPSGAGDDRLELGRVVVVEAGDQAEAVAQRAGDGASAGGGAHQREAGQVEADRASGRALAQPEVDLEVLHRRVEHTNGKATCRARVCQYG